MIHVIGWTLLILGLATVATFVGCVLIMVVRSVLDGGAK